MIVLWLGGCDQFSTGDGMSQLDFEGFDRGGPGFELGPAIIAEPARLEIRGGGSEWEDEILPDESASQVGQEEEVGPESEGGSSGGDPFAGDGEFERSGDSDSALSSGVSR